jgi:hypothetical protein
LLIRKSRFLKVFHLTEISRIQKLDRQSFLYELSAAWPEFANATSSLVRFENIFFFFYGKRSSLQQRKVAGAHPMIASYNASAVKISNAASSLVRFEIKIIFFFYGKRSSLLQRKVAGSHPMIASYNASAVKISNAASSLVRFEIKIIFFYDRRFSLLQLWRCNSRS